MHRCKYCGDKLPDTSRCCYKCGNLNPYNEENINNGYDMDHDVETIDIEETVNNNNLFDLKFKLLIVLDLLCVLLIVFLFNPIGDFNMYLKMLPYVLIWGFYRLTVLRYLLYKSCMSWWGVYIPFYGLWLYFNLGIMSVRYIIITLWVLIFAGYWGYLVPEVASTVNYGSISILKKIVTLVLFIYLFIAHVKICDGYAFRFNKSKKFKILLIIFWPVLIVYLAFNKDAGRLNLEEYSDTKV